MHEELAGRDDVMILAINTGEDSRSAVADFWSEVGYDFTPVVDPPGWRGRLNEVLGGIAFPTNIVVGADGLVKHASYGFDEPRIRALLGL